jgi:hypothetical protein
MSLASLFTRRATLCFLAGSGVSLDQPSCQPTGLQFTRRLISRLVPKERIDQILALTDPEGPGVLKHDRFLRFEDLLSYVQRWDSDLRVLDGYGSARWPNANHLALAQFIRSGHTVFTTNFDNLIEQGLASCGEESSRIRSIVDRREWEARPVSVPVG